MRILISADIEGTACVFHPEQTRNGNPEYEYARKLMTAEVNAAIEGALLGGAKEVIVNDSHGTFRNLLPELLHPEARIILGKPRTLGMMAGLELDVDGVMMVGYHSRSQGKGVLAHTINSFAFSRIWFNDLELGEAGIYGAIAGEFHVPVIFASGDDEFVKENRELFPKAEFVTVKTAAGYGSGISLSPQRAREMITQGSREAIRKDIKTGLFTVSPPITCRLQVQSTALADLFSQLPLLERIDGVTVEFNAPSMQYAVRILNCLSTMSVVLKN